MITQRHVGQNSGMLALCAGILVTGLILGGCQSTPSTHGKDGVQAVYSAGTLTGTIPEPTTTQQVMAAADQMFRDRGYSILESATTDDQGRIVGVPPRDSMTPRVTIQARTTAGGVRVDVSVSPFGSQDLSSSMFDGLLRRLGL
jgi:hypothetical protein